MLQLAESLLSYQPGNGFLHRLNPLTKLFMLVAVIVSGVLLSSARVPFFCMLAVFAVLLLLALVGGVDLRDDFRQRWPFFLVITCLIIVGNLVFPPPFAGLEQREFFTLPPFLHITDLSLGFGIAKSFFVLSSLLGVVLLLRTTRLGDLTYSLTKVGVPHAIAQVIATSLRCIPMVADGLGIVYNAQRARGMEMDAGGPRARIAAWRTLMNPLFVVFLKWVDLMSVVYQARGMDFSFGGARTRLRATPFRAVDGVALVLGLGSLAVLVIATQIGWIHV
nr:energy-coupling factor transporter transmembrane component T [Microbacterium ulmi]